MKITFDDDREDIIIEKKKIPKKEPPKKLPKKSTLEEWLEGEKDE